MLFFANFLSIMLVSSATFIAAGMTPAASLRKDKNFVRSSILAVVGFIVVATFLTYSLVNIVKERKLKDTIEVILNEEFDKLHSTSVDSYVYDVEDGKLYILATVRSPIVMTPKDIKRLQNSFESKIDKPIELIVRSMISNDISATGSTNSIIDQNLNGFFLNKELSADQVLIRNAEQIRLEQLSHWPKMRLVNTEFIEIDRGPTILATVTGFRLLTDHEIKALENKIRESLDDQSVNLIIRMLETTISDRNGQMLYGWIYYENVTEAKKKEVRELDTKVRAKFVNYPKLFVINVHKAFEGEKMNALVEAVGTEPITPEEIGQMEIELSNEMGRDIKLNMWYKSEAIISSHGYEAFENYNEANVRKVEEKLRKRLDQKFW